MDRFKLIAGFSLALACAPALAQDAKPQTVTFKCAAAPLARVVPALAKATGLRMAVDGAIGKVVVQVSAKDADPKALMDKIAEAASGKWTQDGDVYRLSLDNEKARDEARSELNARAEAIKKAIEAGLKGSASGSGPAAPPVRTLRFDARDPNGQPAVAPFESSPAAQKALYQLLQLVGPQALAQIGFGTQVVFAMPANRAQRPLPFAATPIVNSVLAAMPQRQGPPAVAAKVHLVVSRPAMEGFLVAELKIGDPAGRTIARQMGLLSLGKPAKSTEISLKKGGARVALSDTAKDLARLFAMPAPAGGAAEAYAAITTVVVGSGGAVVEPPPANQPAASERAKAALLNLDKEDPLAFLPGEALQAVADAEEINLVACIPDSALVPAATDLNGRTLTVGQVVSSLANWRMEGAVSDGFLTVRPLLPATARAMRLDRGAAAAALKAAAAQGLLTLDQKAAYVNAQPFVDPVDSFESRMMGAFDPAFGSTLLNGLLTGERKMLKFYALLGLPQRQMLLSGRALVLGALLPAARSLVYDMAYNSTSPLTVERPGGRPMPWLGDMASDPTELLPNGVPDQAAVTLQARTRDTAYGIAKSGARVAVSPGTYSVVYQGDPDTGLTPTTTSSASQYSQYQLGKQTQLTFRFQLTPIVSFTRTLTDDRIDPASKPVGYWELPDWFLRQAEEARRNVEQLQNRIQIQGQGQGGQRPPSP